MRLRVPPVTVAALVAVPLAGTLACGMAVEQAHQEQATRHRQSAVLLRDSGSGTIPWKGLGGPRMVRSPDVEVAWTGRYGVRHTAVAQVPTNTKAGAHVSVWVKNRSETLTSAPLGAGDVVLRTLVAAGAAGLAVVITATGTRAVRRSLTVRRHASRIDEEWRLLAPIWSSRHS